MATTISVGVNTTDGGTIELVGPSVGVWGREVRVIATPKPGYTFDRFEVTGTALPQPDCSDPDFSCPLGQKCVYDPATRTNQCVLIVLDQGGPSIGLQFCNSDNDCNGPNVITQNPRQCIDGVCTDSVEDTRLT